MSIKVFVYFNLHKKCWSLKALEGENKGRVIAHEDFVTLVEATPKVSEAGRQRVLKEKRKNVHAGIVGYLDDLRTSEMYFNNLDLQPWDITYNPYKYKSFVHTWDETPFKSAPVVVMNAKARNKVIAFVEDMS